ncbi:hypothetical protein EGI22_05645 [Lacihabitans sp. LS3-19]|uniref:hypothetical protein n=1 Tax=Lacihabitans sp. LS3-19 TaxID=2487335 RepID=UPI0020CD7C7C|nr:hypothetical protein [Lacihabitans sp. LS3-19]MCP9767385.1 hypothetical protein [Lacihabitans sp. LS3-19]
MKKIFLISLLLISFCQIALAQVGGRVEGIVTFVNAKNIYVRFENTKDLEINDTLMVLVNEQWIKSLVVQMVSSKSFITTPIGAEKIIAGDKVSYFKKEIKEDTLALTQIKKKVEPEKRVITKIVEDTERKQSYNGKIMVSANGSMVESEKAYNRVRTSVAFDIYNIKDGKFSFESYVNYRNSTNSLQTEKNFNDNFKVYNLALTYQPTKNSTFSVGRKLNLRMANMGAIDGLQVENKYKNIILGGFGGFRPDVNDYGFNANLLQYGAFIAHEKEKGNGALSTSIAFADKKNNGITDRRFAYFQHSNSIVKNLYLFYSIEVDLYQNIDSIKTHNVNLTSTYLSLRYKPFKVLSFSTSYDNRRNVIYYETYRSYIDQLVNQETRQGFRLNVNYHFSKYMNLNATGFYRYQESRPDPTKNYNINLNFSKLPAINTSLNLSANIMNTYYFDGIIYGARLNKYLMKGRLSTELSYRKVDYAFFNQEQGNLKQNILGASLNLYTQKNTSFMINYEGTFEPTASYNRYFVTLSQRVRSK